MYSQYFRIGAIAAAAFAASAARLGAQPALINNQPIPSDTYLVSSGAHTVNLATFIQNPLATGTVVRIAVGTWNPNSNTIAPSSMIPIGNIDVALTDSLTPNTVANFLAYINSGSFVDNIIHRSIPGFIIQGGEDFFFVSNGNVALGSVPTIAPVPFERGLSNVAGTIAMAQAGSDQNSATSQWFINLVDNSENLDNQNGGFCAFGTVLGNGMAVANAVAALSTFDFSAYIDSAWTNLPLVNYTSQDYTAFTQGANNLALADFIFTNISVIPALTFAANSANTSLVTTGVSNNTLTLTPVGTNIGSTNITVTATDTENNTFQANFTVTISPPDAIPPTLTIASPADNTTVTSANLTVSGTATDSGTGNNGISSVTVNGATAIGGTATGNGTANWSVNVTLSYGANTITVIAQDALNNSVQKTITVTCLQSFADWAAAINFANPADATAMATPANDGVPNLLKFAFGGNPLLPTLMPGAPADVPGINGGIAFYLRQTAALTYEVDESTDMFNWSPIWVSTSGNAGTAVASFVGNATAGFDSIIIHDPAPANVTERFWRVKVTETP